MEVLGFPYLLLELTYSLATGVKPGGHFFIAYSLKCKKRGLRQHGLPDHPRRNSMSNTKPFIELSQLGPLMRRLDAAAGRHEKTPTPLVNSTVVSTVLFVTALQQCNRLIQTELSFVDGYAGDSSCGVMRKINSNNLTSLNRAYGAAMNVSLFIRGLICSEMNPWEREGVIREIKKFIENLNKLESLGAVHDAGFLDSALSEIIVKASTIVYFLENPKDGLPISSEKRLHEKVLEQIASTGSSHQDVLSKRLLLVFKKINNVSYRVFVRRWREEEPRVINAE